MTLVQTNDSLNEQVMSAVIEVLAQRADVCAKVIDHLGEVVAVNRRGLEMLGRSAEDICGQAWSAIWHGPAAQQAQAALEAAKGGERSRFTARLGDEPADRVWEIEVLPLPVSVAHSALALTSERGRAGAPATDVLARLETAIHAFANVANTAASGARLLQRGLAPEMAGALADDLDAAATRASDEIERLRDLMGGPADPDAA